MRQSFSPELKNNAARLVLGQDYSYAETTRAIEVHENILRIWLKQLESECIGIPPKSKALSPEQQRTQELEV